MHKQVLISLALFAAPLSAQTLPDTPVNTVQDALTLINQQREQNASLTKILEDSKFSGTLGIAGQKLTYSWQYDRERIGPSDKGFNAPLWRWASVTKQVIAVLVLQEVAKGTIGLDKPLSEYSPRFKSANAGKITVRQLLRHQSGLPNPDDSAASADSVAAYYLPGYKGSRDPLTGYCAGTPKGEPGGNWAYNNCDYIVAGALLEAVTGKKWSKLVQDRINKPLGLKTMGAYPAGKLTHSGVIGGQPEPKIELSAFAAAGGLYGTLSDLLEFDRALMSGKLLAKKELDQLWDGQPDLGYIALGQWVFDAPLKECPSPVKLVERRGSIGGVQVRNFIAPDKQTAVAIFTDKSESDFEFGEIWQGSGFSHDVLNFALCPKAPDSK
jgi:D-alanyl-D-alanine carboxypeptidase